MKNKNNENLEQFLQGLYTEQELAQFKQDIKFANNIFDATPAPAPSAATLANIKNNIAKHNFKTKLYHRIITAAAVIVVLAISSLLFTNITSTQYQVTLTTANWQSSNLELDDQDLLEIQTSIDYIENQLSSNDFDGIFELSDSLADIESDFANLDETFWKG